MCYCYNSVKNKAAWHFVILSHSTDYYDSVIVTLENITAYFFHHEEHEGPRSCLRITIYKK